jgi:hypothetical protein
MVHLYPLDPEGTMLLIRQESRDAERRAAVERRARSARERTRPVAGGGGSMGRLLSAWRRGRRPRAAV